MHQFPQIGRRLKRASGHLDSVVAMLESGRPCLDVAQQLHAVEKAIGNARKELIKEHLHHCLTESTSAMPRAVRKWVAEFQAVAKYL